MSTSTFNSQNTSLGHQLQMGVTIFKSGSFFDSSPLKELAYSHSLVFDLTWGPRSKEHDTMEADVFGDHGEVFRALDHPPCTPALASRTLSFLIFEVETGHVSDDVSSCKAGPCPSCQWQHQEGFLALSGRDVGWVTVPFSGCCAEFGTVFVSFLVAVIK